METFQRPKETLDFLRQHIFERMDALVDVNPQGRREFHLQRYRFAASCLRQRGLRPALVVDAACGTGYGSKVLLKVCERYQGVDASQGSVSYARRFYGSERTRFDCADVSDMPFLETGSADCVVSFETIEHVPRDLETVREFRRILKPGGTLIISVPNRWPLTLYHVNDYDERSVRRLLNCHFAIEGIFNQSCGREVTAEGLESAECLLVVSTPKPCDPLSPEAVREISLNQIDALIAHKIRLEAEIQRIRRLSLYRFGPAYHALRRLLGLESGE